LAAIWLLGAPVFRRFKNTVSQLAVSAVCHFAVCRRRNCRRIPNVTRDQSGHVAARWRFWETQLSQTI